MKHLIDKSDIVAEIEKRIELFTSEKNQEGASQLDKLSLGGRIAGLQELKVFLDTLKVKEMVEYKQPEYGCLKTIYQCGKKPHWNIGDTLAYYEFYSDREGEFVLGKITKVDFDEEQCDWSYTFEDGSLYYEQSLLEEQTYKKN